MAKNEYWKLDIISIHQPKVKITLYKKAFLFHHTVDKIMLKCISAPGGGITALSRLKIVADYEEAFIWYIIQTNKEISFLKKQNYFNLQTF